MITARAWAGRHYAVLGLARSGLATVAALIASGASVTAWDDRADARNEAGRLGATLTDPAQWKWQDIDAVVVSPGVPINTHAVGVAARQAGVPIIGDIELFAQARGDLPLHRVVGITGTNGKSTTTALITHILTTTGVPTRMAGNIGLPILGQEPLADGGVYVLELSSYQIDLTQSLACDVAVLTNLAPDHLDRYENSFDLYAASKKRLFAMQSDEAVAIITVDDVTAEAMARSIGPRVTTVSRNDVDPVQQADWPALAGPHGQQNAACAIAACRALGVSADKIAAGLRSFGGLAHRTQRIATVAGVVYVNDSKATNAASSAPALMAFPPIDGHARIHWIVGGRPKGDGLAACAPYFKNVRAAYLIGEAADAFQAELSPLVPIVRSGTLQQAVDDAVTHAVPGDVVLLSPACASFDQFTDYEARGDAFRAAVEAHKVRDERAHGGDAGTE